MVESLRDRILRLPTLSTLRSQMKDTINVNAEHEAHLSRIDRLAICVTDKIGTMGFFFIILIWTVVWLGWNVVGPADLRFDPYPAFVLWLFISNLIQIHLMPLIMVGQNLQGRHAEIRAESDYEVNLKAELEVEAILTHLEHQNELMLQILERIEGLEKQEIQLTQHGNVLPPG